jgi:hydroxymethylpyrimidine/phosphomethylpyrimidine kinase
VARIARALTIAGSDSGGGAGIQADLKTFAAFGVYGMSALAALTAQNTVGVRGIIEIDQEFVSLQIRAVVEDMGVDAVKTGMLSNAAIISQVAKDLRDLSLENVVVDPVMVAKGGDRLLRADAMEAMTKELFPLALVVTPNLHEVAALIGLEVKTLEDMKEAALAIKALGPRYAVIKGGHLPGKPLDLLFDGKQFREYTNVRYDTPHTHGTGCTFASAIAAGLALGMSVEEAVARAKAYITAAIREGIPLGNGHGPVNHLYNLYRLAGWNRR